MFEYETWLLLAHSNGHFSAVVFHGMKDVKSAAPLLIHMDSFTGEHMKSQLALDKRLPDAVIDHFRPSS